MNIVDFIRKAFTPSASSFFLSHLFQYPWTTVLVSVASLQVRNYAFCGTRILTAAHQAIIIFGIGYGGMKTNLAPFIGLSSSCAIRFFTQSSHCSRPMYGCGVARPHGRNKNLQWRADHR
jgi:hypothetical protein